MNPSHKIVYEEEGLKFIFVDIGGQLSFHIENEIDINSKRLKHIHELFTSLLYVLDKKGMNHLDTWIPPEMDKEIRFAESFGFVPTGYDKIVSLVDGRDLTFTELRITF